MDKGQAVEQERRVQFQGGEPVTVDFRSPGGEELKTPQKKLPTPPLPDKKLPTPPDPEKKLPTPPDPGK
jgi:hypothetical protein